MKYIKPEHCLNHRLAIILMKLDIMDYKRWIITEAKSTESNSSKIQYYFFFWMFMINCISFTTLYLGLKNEEKKTAMFLNIYYFRDSLAIWCQEWVLFNKKTDYLFIVIVIQGLLWRNYFQANEEGSVESSPH